MREALHRFFKRWNVIILDPPHHEMMACHVFKPRGTLFVEPRVDRVKDVIAKAGNIAMTKTLAKELGPDVRINSVAPGAILWPEHESDDTVKQDSVLSKVPMGRLGTENDIAQTVYFLAVEATYMTGQTIAVDGGSSNSL